MKRRFGSYPQAIKTVYGDAFLLGFSEDRKQALVSLRRSEEEITKLKGKFYNRFIPVSDILTSEDGD